MEFAGVELLFVLFYPPADFLCIFERRVKKKHAYTKNDAARNGHFLLRCANPKHAQKG